MNLSLARWDYNGSSAGFWMVRELPSVLISFAGKGRGWRIQCGADLFDGFEADACRVWGADYEAHTRRLPDPSLKQRYYPTRYAALSTLEAALPTAHKPTLSELVA